MTEFSDRPGYSFDPGPPPEASRFFRNKGLRPSFGFEDVEPEEHAVAFAVAKMAELDMLEAARAEVQKVIDDGLTFDAFQKSWRSNPKLADWWGKKEMTDPLTGEVIQAQLGSPRRLKTIYRANLATARAAGQWERIERTKGALPYLEYRLGPSEQHRHHHETKAGMILPVESAFWDEWMPPNGWGCKCWVRQVTRREAERRGIATTPDIPDQKYRNPRTGEVAIVPQGIDPGWQRNLGKLRLQAVAGMLKDKLDAAPDAVQRAALKDIASSWRVERLMTDPKAKGNVPIAILPIEYLDVLPDAKRVIEISDVTRVHVAEEKSDRRIADLSHLATIDQAARVVFQRRPGQHPRLIFELDTAMEPESADPYFRLPLRVYVVIKSAGSFVHSFHRTTDARWRKLRDGYTSTVLKGG